MNSQQQNKRPGHRLTCGKTKPKPSQRHFLATSFQQRRNHAQAFHDTPLREISRRDSYDDSDNFNRKRGNTFQDLVELFNEIHDMSFGCDLEVSANRSRDPPRPPQDDHLTLKRGKHLFETKSFQELRSKCDNEPPHRAV